MRKELSKLKEELIDGNTLLCCTAPIYIMHIEVFYTLETKILETNSQKFEFVFYDLKNI